MATMTEPKAEKQTLVHYLVESGVAMLQLDDAILQARFDDTVHVLVLRGHGEKFFSAGANIAYLNSITPRYKYFFCLHANETLNRLEQTPKLTIAALNGHTEGFWEQVVLYAKQFCPPNKASKAVGLIKRAVQSGAEVPFESGLTLERELQQQLFQSEDAKEGIAAYVEKRVAEFKGR